MLYCQTPVEFPTGHIGLLKGEHILLITPWLSSWWISFWMGIRESWLGWYYCWCTVIEAIDTFCSLTLMCPTIEGSSDKLGKIDSCSFSSVSTGAIADAHQYPLRHLSQSQYGAHATHVKPDSFQLPLQSVLGILVTLEIQMHSISLWFDGIRVPCTPVSTKALYPCGSDVLGHTIP